MKLTVAVALAATAHGQLFGGNNGPTNVLTESQFDFVNLQIDRLLTRQSQPVPVADIINLVFTDCMNGECDGCVSVPAASTTSPLATAGEQLQLIYNGFDAATRLAMSRADFWVLTANKGYLYSATNPQQEPTQSMENLVTNFRYGRPSVTCSALTATTETQAAFDTCTAEVNAGTRTRMDWQTCVPEPSAFDDQGGYSMLLSLNDAIGLNLNQLTALLGFRTLGQKERTASSGFTGRWVPDANVFDNQYYNWMLGHENLRRNWVMGSVGNGQAPERFQWSADGTTMLNSDLALLYQFDSDAQGRAVCNGVNMATAGAEFLTECAENQFRSNNGGLVFTYRNNWRTWMDDFASVWTYYTQRSPTNRALFTVNNDNFFDQTFENDEREVNVNCNTGNNGLGGLGGLGGLFGR